MTGTPPPRMSKVQIIELFNSFGSPDSDETPVPEAPRACNQLDDLSSNSTVLLAFMTVCLGEANFMQDARKTDAGIRSINTGIDFIDLERD